MSKKVWDGKIQKDEFVQLQEASAQVMGMDALLFNGSNIQEFIDYLKSSLMEKYPNMFFKIVKAPLSNDDELTIYGSLDPKESWSNKIFENSNYFILNVDNKGYMRKTLTSLYRKGMKYHIDGRVEVNFPKQKAKNREDMLRRLTVFIDNADASVNESKVRKESAMNMNLYHASREIEHFMKKYSDPSPENFIELAKSLASRLGFKNADQRKIDELAFHLNNEWDHFTRVKAVDIGDLERIVSYLMDRNVKENSDQSTAKARSEWADLKLAEELFPETATLDRYLHVANILHATGLYKEEAEALSRARTKLNLKDPEYSKKLDYIKNMEKWNIKAMKDRGIGERQIKESVLIKGDGHNVSIANRFWNEWNNIKEMTKYRIDENKIMKVEENVLQPKTKEQLKTLIKQEIAKKGNRANLNHIDVSKIADMSYLFFMSNFNGDISKWDVSNVETMDSMFFRSDFNGDISKWDVGNVKNMMVMFSESDFNGDISKWNVSKVINMSAMFQDSKFNGDISKWKINNKCDTKDMFKGTSNGIRKDIPSSYKKLFGKYSKYLKSGNVKDVKDIEDGLEKANRIKIFSDLLGSFSKGDGDVKKGFNWLFDIMSKRYNFSPDDIYSEVEYICAKILKNEQSKKKVVDESQRMATNIDEIKQWFADRGYEISDTVRGKDKNGVYYVIFTRDEIRDEDMPDLRMWENYSVSMGDKNMRNTRGIAHVFYIPSEPVDEERKINKEGTEVNVDPRDKVIGEIASYAFQKMKEISYKDPLQRSNGRGITISHPKYTSPEYMWDIRKGYPSEEEDRSGRIDISFYSEIIYTGSSYADPKLAYQNTSATMYRRRKAKDYGIFDINTTPIEKIQKWIDKNVKKIITLKSGSYKKY